MSAVSDYSAIISTEHEFCPRCEANLTLQKGYSNELPYWECRGCGEMLINPIVPGDIAWICDRCEAMLNIQDGFYEECGHFVCTKCGYDNKIDVSEIYASEDEYRLDSDSPYKGLSDEDVLALSMYVEEAAINNREDVCLVRHMADNKLYVKKILTIYDITIYKYLLDHPLPYMPKICEIYEGNNCLIIIEEYIEGKTLAEMVESGVLTPVAAAGIVIKICAAVKQLHDLDTPIIHRDIKPSNVIVRDDGEVFLLDMNAAKWYRADEAEDTRLLGTQYYAAPEQAGYGFAASSKQSDIYAIGMLLNVLTTGKFPKEEKAPKLIWDVVEKCICLEQTDRYTDDELIEALEKIINEAENAR